MSKDKKKISIALLIKSLVILSGAIYFIVICWAGLSKEYVEDGWKTTQGKVLNSEMILTGNKNIERKREGIEQTINYEYKIDDRTFQSNSVSIEAFVKKEDYPEGKIIDVYYNPNNITESILVLTKTQQQYLYAMILFCMVIIGVTLFHLIRDLREV